MKRHWTAFYKLKKLLSCHSIHMSNMSYLWKSITFECSTILYLLLFCDIGNIFEIIYAIVLFYYFHYKLISILITKTVSLGFPRNNTFESYIVYINPSGVSFTLKANTTMDGADRLY